MAHPHRATDGGPHPVGQVHGHGEVGDILGRDHELVAAQAGYDVARPDCVAQAPGDRGEHGVAGGMAERVVDLLEPVEVDVQDRAPRTGQPGFLERLAQAMQKTHPVGQSGQAVVGGLLVESLGGLDPLGDVAHVAHQAADGRVVEAVDDCQLDVAPTAVGVGEATLERGHCAWKAGGVSYPLGDEIAVVGVKHVEQRLADELRRVQAGDSGKGGADVGQPTVGVADHDQVAPVLDQGGEAGVGPLQGCLGVHFGGHVAGRDQGPAHHGVIEQIGHNRFEPAPRPVAMPDPGAYRHAGTGGSESAQRRAHGVPVVAVQPAPGGAAHRLGGIPSEEAFPGPGHRDHGSVGVDDGDECPTAVDEGLEPALPKRHLGGDGPPCVPWSCRAPWSRSAPWSRRAAGRRSGSGSRSHSGQRRRVE
ncbi:MAG TPA: hypothetical protein VG184_06625 [Acidimicrobiales bacterium]|nr:hypothetical protein [Acidimicrobiales bacterium]